jgi:hypothetical protein
MYKIKYFSCSSYLSTSALFYQHWFQVPLTLSKLGHCQQVFIAIFKRNVDNIKTLTMANMTNKTTIIVRVCHLIK